MAHYILRDILIFGLIMLFVFALDYRKAFKNLHLLLLFFTIGFIDNFFNTLTIEYPALQLIKADIWNNSLYCNWSPKIYSIVFAAALIPLLKPVLSTVEIGLNFRQKENSVKFSLLSILFFSAAASALGLLSRKGPFDAGVLLFLLLMPGISEELIYRGFLLGLLNKIFDKKFTFWGTAFGWGAVVTSIVFGFLHGFELTEDLRFQINAVNIILPGLYGFFYALIKERSGSLLFPILAHSAADFFNYFWRMI